MEDPPGLEQLCQRYGVPLAFGERLLPLLQRAQEAAPDIRKRIIQLVESSFEHEAQRLALQQVARRTAQDADLCTLASLLHEWAPPNWILDWDRRSP